MTPDGFLTFLALLAAVYAIAPNVNRTALRLNSTSTLLTSAGALLIVMYLQFFDHVGMPCIIGVSEVCSILTIEPPRTIKAGDVAYLVVLVWLMWVLLTLRRPKLSARALPGLAKVVGELADDRRFGELLELVEPQLKVIDRAAQRKLPLQRLHTTLSEPKTINVDLGNGDGRGWMVRRHWIVRYLARLIPSGKQLEDAARLIINRLTKSEELRRYVAKYRSRVGIGLLGLKSWEARHFSEDYLTDLINSPGSSLYEEIRHNQNITAREYVIDDQNRLLWFLFSDPSVAQQISAYRPVGEAVIRSLRKDMHPKYVDFLNGPADDFDEEKWRDPVFVGVRFFDIMVRAAMSKGTPWHMWLFYHHHIMQALLQITDIHPIRGVNVEAEFPTRGTFLIYTLIHDLSAWIATTAYLEEGEHHLNIAAVDTEHENSNIPKSASICLGGCLAMVLLSGKLPLQFKTEMLSVVVRRIADLEREGPRAKIRSAAVACVVTGGSGKPDAQYGAELKACLATVDHVLRDRADDFMKSVRKTYP